MRVLAAALGGLALLSLQCGCSLFRSRYQDVVITTNVPATVHVDGNFRGRTTTDGLVVQGLARRRNHWIVVTADGYGEESERIQSIVSGWGALDAVGAMLFLLPVIPFITGQAFELDPGYVHFELQHETAGSLPETE